MRASAEAIENFGLTVFSFRRSARVGLKKDDTADVIIVGVTSAFRRSARVGLRPEKPVGREGVNECLGRTSTTSECRG